VPPKYEIALISKSEYVVKLIYVQWACLKPEGVACGGSDYI
jgi:hypothetical protein